MPWVLVCCPPVCPVVAHTGALSPGPSPFFPPDRTPFPSPWQGSVGTIPEQFNPMIMSYPVATVTGSGMDT